MEEEEPVTPMGRLCLLPEHNHVIHCAIGLENAIDIDALKHEISNSIMIKIPRFSCIMTVDPRDGSEHWKKVNVDLDDHIIIQHNYTGGTDSDGQHPVSEDDVINSYLADMAISSPMRMDKPLWELHIMHAQKCIIMRVHHAIADGMSLMSLLWTMGRPSKDMTTSNNKNYANITSSGANSLKNMGLYIWKSLVCLWYTMVFGLIFVLRCLWVKDKGKISGFSGVEFWPREVATAKFKISDMKIIKKAIPNATVNDVLCGIIWCGLTRYLNIQYPKDLQDGHQITGMCPYNLRQQAGVQVAGLFYYNLFCNTSFLISNIAGPTELISIGGNPVTSIRVTSSSQPHAMTMHMVGYQGWANLQIQVAKDVIPDPKVLAKCFENALVDMKEAVLRY